MSNLNNSDEILVSKWLHFLWQLCSQDTVEGVLLWMFLEWFQSILVGWNADFIKENKVAKNVQLLLNNITGIS